MKIEEENVTKDIPSGDNDLADDVTVVTLCPTLDDATTLTEGEGKVCNIIPSDYFLKSNQRINKPMRDSCSKW